MAIKIVYSVYIVTGLFNILIRVNSLPPNTERNLGSHHDFCNETIPCNQSSLLSCQESYCDCILTDSMIFSEESGRCVSLADEACGHMSMDTSEVLLQCVANATCNNQGYCQCIEGHFKDDDGHCTSQKDFGDSCNSHLECFNDLGLLCINGTCNCNKTVSIDSLKFGDTFPDHRCLGRAGLPCLNSHCVPNSSCKNKIIGLKNQKMCMCQPGFEETSRGLCLATFNKTCDIQNHIYCKKGLACVNGLCHCKYPRDQVFDKSSGKCLTLIGGPCYPSSYSDNNIDSSKLSTSAEMKCISNAICQKSGEHSDYSQCECEDGFVENRERRCDIAYGYPCSSTTVLSTFSGDEDGPAAKCDQLAQLTCRDGQCLCIDEGQMFDKYLWKCRGLVGSFCAVTVGGDVSAYGGIIISNRGNNSTDRGYCVKNAECRRRRSGRLFHGQCQCRDDFEETEARTCSCSYCNEEE